MSALGRSGSWAALLVPCGVRDGHWVVVDGLTDGGAVAIRDPIGSSCRTPFDDFAATIRHMVVVFETRGLQ